MIIFEYIILGLSFLITLGWCLQVRHKAKKEQAREKSMELTGFLMTVSVVLIPLFHFSSLHLFWMIPASFILGLLSITTPLRILWMFSSIYFSFWYIGIINSSRKFDKSKPKNTNTITELYSDFLQDYIQYLVSDEKVINKNIEEITKKTDQTLKVDQLKKEIWILRYIALHLWFFDLVEPKNQEELDEQTKLINHTFKIIQENNRDNPAWRDTFYQDTGMPEVSSLNDFKSQWGEKLKEKLAHIPFECTGGRLAGELHNFILELLMRTLKKDFKSFQMEGNTLTKEEVEDIKKTIKEVEPTEEETEEALIEAIEKVVVDTDGLSRRAMPTDSFLSDWQTVISPNKEFKVKLPRDCEEYTNAKETKKETLILSYTGFENNKTQAYLVQRNDYSALFLRSNIQEAESSMEKKLIQVRMDGFAETIGGENIQCQYDTFKDFTALRFSTEGRAKKLTMRGLIFMKGPVIYSLIGYSEKLDEDKLREFFDSFQFVPEVES